MSCYSQAYAIEQLNYKFTFPSWFYSIRLKTAKTRIRPRIDFISMKLQSSKRLCAPEVESGRIANGYCSITVRLMSQRHIRMIFDKRGRWMALRYRFRTRNVHPTHRRPVRKATWWHGTMYSGQVWPHF
jgi:hypothetical protein